jgi:co-chaperonin GroES (HSP10)
MAATAEEVQQLIAEAKLLEPTSGRCIVVRDRFKYSGLIAIPDRYKQMPTTGHVVAVGNSEQEHLVGKRIVWGRFSGVPVQFDKRPAYDILTYEEILAFLNDTSVELTMEDMSALSRSE